MLRSVYCTLQPVERVMVDMRMAAIDAMDGPLCSVREEQTHRLSLSLAPLSCIALASYPLTVYRTVTGLNCYWSEQERHENKKEYQGNTYTALPACAARTESPRNSDPLQRRVAACTARVYMQCQVSTRFALPLHFRDDSGVRAFAAEQSLPSSRSHEISQTQKTKRARNSMPSNAVYLRFIMLCMYVRACQHRQPREIHAGGVRSRMECATSSLPSIRAGSAS